MKRFYPDCRKAFYQAFELAARLDTDELINIKSPFSGMSISEVLTIALRLGAPLEKAWSCYLEGPLHCGKCESCNNRENAFKEAGLVDPTRYINS